MRLTLAIALAGCGFSGHGTPDEGVVVDAAIDAAIDFCPTDEYVQLCYSFDVQPFARPLANEGTVPASATLTGVTPIHREGRSAAQFGVNTGMSVESSPDLTAIRSLEVWFHPDALPTNPDDRFGLVDNDENLNAFYYNLAGNPQVRCEVGNAIYTSTVAPAPGAWIYVACVCNDTTPEMYINGVIVSTTGDTTCALNGPVGILTIGENNDGMTPPAVGNDPLRGSIDGIRLWSLALRPSTICEHAGRNPC